MTQRSTLPAACALLAMALALAGCSGTGAPPGASPATGSGGGTAGSTTPGGSTGTGSPSVAPTPSDPLGVPSSAQSIIAQDALVSQTCTADAAGAWSFSGTVRNDSQERRTYTVAIAVTDGPSVAGHSLQTVTVSPGGTAEVRAEAFAVTSGQGPSGPAQLRCDAVVSQEVAK